MDQLTDEEIREHWFPEHRAYYRMLGTIDGPAERLIWARPKSNHYKVVYQLSEGVLYVGGDIGYATYVWNHDLSLRVIAACDLSYFSEKCVASEIGRGYRTWSSAAAEDTIKRYFTDTGASAVRFDELGGWSACWDEREWYAWLAQYAHQADVDPVYLAGAGQIISPRCRGHLIGLKMAVEQLDDPGPEQASEEGA